MHHVGLWLLHSPTTCIAWRLYMQAHGHKSPTALHTCNIQHCMVTVVPTIDLMIPDLWQGAIPFPVLSIVGRHACVWFLIKNWSYCFPTNLINIYSCGLSELWAPDQCYGRDCPTLHWLSVHPPPGWTDNQCITACVFAHMQDSICTHVETCRKTPDAHDGKGYSGFIFVGCHMLTVDFPIVSLIVAVQTV